MNVPANNLGSDRWYATDGIVHIGPIAFDSLARELAHGRGPELCHVRHETWQIWQRLSDMLTLSRRERDSKVATLAELSAAASSQASSPTAEQRRHRGDIPAEQDSPPRTAIRPTMVDPVGVLSSADSLDSALLITLCTAVTASLAEVGLLHRATGEGRTLITSGTQGPKAETLLGTQLSADDPSVRVARHGQTLIAEPAPGETAKPVFERLGRCIEQPLGSAMVPLVLDDRLVAMFELGRRQPFLAREIGRVEEVLQALVERSVFAGWFD